MRTRSLQLLVILSLFFGCTPPPYRRADDSTAERSGKVEASTLYFLPFKALSELLVPPPEHQRKKE